MIFDHKRFKKYKSNSKIVEPKLSKKWILKTDRIDEQGQEDPIFHNLHDYSIIYLTDEFGQTFESNTSMVLNWLLRNKGTINKDGILTSEFIIDRKGVFCSKKIYNDWKHKTTDNKVTQIAKKDLKPGYIYEYEDKSHFIYLGTRFVATWNVDKNGKLLKTNVTKKDLGYLVYNHNSYKTGSLYINNYKNVSKKVVKEIKKSDVDLEVLWKHFQYSKNVYFISETKPKNIVVDIQFKEVQPSFFVDIRKKYDINYIDAFHHFDYFHIFNSNMYITDDMEKDSDYSRNVDKNGTLIFQEIEKSNIIKISNSYFNDNDLLREATETTDNSHYWRAPNNFYIIEAC